MTSESLYWHIIRPLRVVVTLSTIVNNIIVLCVLVIHHHHKRGFGNKFRFIISLTVADLLLGIVSEPLAIWTATADDWPYGYEVCRFWQTATTMIFGAVSGSIVNITIDRFIYIQYSLRYHNIVTGNVSRVMILFVWAIAITVALPSLVGDTALRSDIPAGSCIFTWAVWYSTVVFVDVFFVPLLILVTLNFTIFVIALRQIHATSQVTVIAVINVDERSHSNGTSTAAPTQKIMRATRNTAILIIPFIITILPVCIFTLYRTGVGEPIDPVSLVYIDDSLGWLMYINSAINPWIYCCDSDFRAALSKLFRLDQQQTQNVSS